MGPQPHSCGRTQGVLLFNTGVGADVLDGPRRLLLVERTWALPVTTPKIMKQETLYDIKFSIIVSRRNELWH